MYYMSIRLLVLRYICAFQPTIWLLSDKKRASHVLTTAQSMETETQKDSTVATEVAKKQVLVQYLKVSTTLFSSLSTCLA